MKGFSTLEIMIALVLMTLVIVASVQVALEIPLALTQSQEKLTATKIASAQLQKEFLLGLTSFSSITPIATTSLSSGYSMYAKSLTSELLSDGVTKQLTSIVSWLNAEGIIQYVIFYGLITDFDHPYPTLCPDIVSGDWLHPTVITITMPGPVQTLSIESSILIAGVPTALTNTAPTLFFFSLASSTNPTLVSTLDTASSTKNGPAAEATNGSLLYLANSDPVNFDTCVVSVACNQLEILDGITTNGTSSNSPYVRTSFKLATSTAPFATGSASQSAGKSILYVHGLIYLGLQKTSGTLGDEFNIIDVHNPDSPIWIGGYHIGRTVNHIEVVDGLAYLATDDPTREVVILDVHNPSQITIVGTYDAPGISTYGYGEGLSIASTTLLLGRSYISGHPLLTELSIASSSFPVVMSTGPTTTSTTTSSIESVLLESTLGFVLTTSALEVWRISSKTAPTLLISIPLPNASSTSNASLICRNRSLYIASADATHKGYLTIITGS
jgi:hypothetical protein